MFAYDTTTTITQSQNEQIGLHCLSFDIVTAVVDLDGSTVSGPVTHEPTRPSCCAAAATNDTDITTDRHVGQCIGVNSAKTITQINVDTDDIVNACSFLG